jgi:hypothetical protein
MKYLPCLLWPVFVVIKLVGVVLGLAVVPLALATRNITVEKGDHSGHWPDMFWLWGNDEEGCPEWWFTRAANGKAGKVAQWFPQFWWYAIRNPVNNMRYLFDDVSLSDCYYKSNWQWDKPMEAQQIREAGMGSAFYYIQHSWMSGFRKVWLNSDGRYSEFWIGWKLASGVPGLGFAMQLRLKRKVGT